MKLNAAKGTQNPAFLSNSARNEQIKHEVGQYSNLACLESSFFECIGIYIELRATIDGKAGELNTNGEHCQVVDLDFRNKFKQILTFSFS